MNVFKDVINHYCRCTQDSTGEYATECKIDFLLTTPIVFEITGVSHIIDRIRMQVYESWGDDLEFLYANETEVFKGLHIAKYILRALYKKILKEEKNGILKDWFFDGDLANLYYKEI